VICQIRSARHRRTTLHSSFGIVFQHMLKCYCYLPALFGSSYLWRTDHVAEEGMPYGTFSSVSCPYSRPQYNSHLSGGPKASLPVRDIDAVINWLRLDIEHISRKLGKVTVLLSFRQILVKDLHCSELNTWRSTYGRHKLVWFDQFSSLVVAWIFLRCVRPVTEGISCYLKNSNKKVHQFHYQSTFHVLGAKDCNVWIFSIVGKVINYRTTLPSSYCRWSTKG